MARSNDWSSSTRCKSGVLDIAHEDVWNVRDMAIIMVQTLSSMLTCCLTALRGRTLRVT
jgi:hypothetical protein